MNGEAQAVVSRLNALAVDALIAGGNGEIDTGPEVNGTFVLSRATVLVAPRERSSGWTPDREGN